VVTMTGSDLTSQQDCTAPGSSPCGVLCRFTFVPHSVTLLTVLDPTWPVLVTPVQAGSSATVALCGAPPALPADLRPVSIALSTLTAGYAVVQISVNGGLDYWPEVLSPAVAAAAQPNVIVYEVSICVGYGRTCTISEQIRTLR